MTIPRRAALVFVPLLALGCIQDDGDRWAPWRALEMISVDQEREIGMDFDRQLQRAVDVVHDPQVAGFANDLGQRIASQIEPQPFLYRFRIVHANSLNAFAVPGGYVYLHSRAVLAAGSLDELAGVVGHEIAHVKARHIARLRQQTQIPDLLVGIAGIAAAVATREPGVYVATQATNVALKLRFSRELETEADDLGGVFAARAGFDPAGSARFFERILEEKNRNPVDIPPYLYSHPQVEDRIEAVRGAAKRLPRSQPPGPGLEEAFRTAQRRLGMMVQTGRSRIAGDEPRYDRSRTDPLLERARTLVEAGEADPALAVLTEASLREPDDPRVAFEIGELLAKERRWEGAIAAYRRTIQLDSSRALVFYRLGLAYRAVGDRARAVYHLEQALFRAGDKRLRESAERVVILLTFGVVSETGFADGGPADETPAGAQRDRFGPRDTKLVWWGRLTPRFVSRANALRVRWRDPSGQVAIEHEPVAQRRVHLVSRLDLAEPARAGEWSVELLLDGEVVDRSRVTVDP